MAFEPVNGWDQRVLIASESALGTSPLPVVGHAIEALTFDPGPGGERGVIRDKKDRQVGRGMRNDFVEGRVLPVAWALEKSLMSRAAIDSSPIEKPLLVAAGLVETVNAATSVVYTPSADPIALGNFQSMTLRRLLGAQTQGATESQEVYGALVQTLNLTGGGSEVGMKFGGVAQGSRFGGVIDSITLASNVVTAMTISAEDSYRISAGTYYLCEAEVIQVSAVTPGNTTATIVRGLAGTTAAAHTAQKLYPWLPTVSSLTGRPISEATTSGTLASINLRAMKWTANLTTGMAPLPGELGSKRFQGVKNTRYDLGITIESVLHREEVAWLGYASSRRLLALSLSQGSAVGGRIALAAPYCELDQIKVPDTANDTVTVTLNLRVRDNAGNDAFSITLT